MKGLDDSGVEPSLSFHVENARSRNNRVPKKCALIAVLITIFSDNHRKLPYNLLCNHCAGKQKK